jgi:hypothetical protein
MRMEDFHDDELCNLQFSLDYMKKDIMNRTLAGMGERINIYITLLDTLEGRTYTGDHTKAERKQKGG